jgi:endonuclease YncB( thermonuclease family)
MGGCLSSLLQVLHGNAASDEARHHPPSSSLSPVYDKLPNDAKKYPVRNVYDGDTLTLVNEDRVRLLGVDTPEIKEKQPFAQEAKEYTKTRCHKQDIWISFEPGGEPKDHYGRLLAFVWVQDGDGYLCVNEGLVAAGFATAYTPNKSSKLHNWGKLVALQKLAREQGRGMWKSFVDRGVVKTANGSAYHVRSCEHLSNVKHLTELKASKATEEGLHPCRTCLA